MNLLEFVCFLTLVAFVVLCSGGLGRVLAIPAAAAVIPISGLLIFLLRLLTKIPTRVLLILSIPLVLVALLSIGLARELGVREAIFATPIAAGLVFIAIQSRLLMWRRAPTPNPGKHE